MIRYLLILMVEFGPLNTIILKCISNLILYSIEYFFANKETAIFFHTNEQPCILFDMDDPFFLMNAHFISTSNTSSLFSCFIARNELEQFSASVNTNDV
jgi:hypothetical protein